MWLSELTVCLSWGCCCCNASCFFWGGGGGVLRHLPCCCCRLDPLNALTFVSQAPEWVDMRVPNAEKRPSVAALPNVPCICSICRAAVGSQRIVCRNKTWPSAETAAMQPARSSKAVESERGNIFVAAEFCSDTSLDVRYIAVRMCSNKHLQFKDLTVPFLEILTCLPKLTLQNPLLSAPSFVTNNYSTSGIDSELNVRASCTSKALACCKLYTIWL